MTGFGPLRCQQPYHVEHISSRPITKVKQRWVQSVLGWVTAWEHWMLLASLFCPFYSFLSTLLIHFRPPSPVSSPKTSRTFSLLYDFFLRLSFFDFVTIVENFASVRFFSKIIILFTSLRALKTFHPSDFFLRLSFFLLRYDRWKRFIRPNFF